MGSAAPGLLVTQLSLDLRLRSAQSGRRPGLTSTLSGVTEPPRDPRLVDRLSRQGEETLGRLVEELATNPVVATALARALQAREKAGQAQEAAMGALGIPSAADIERLTRRLRSVSQRLEGIEDALDRLEVRIDSMATARTAAADAGGLHRLEGRLDEIAVSIAALRTALGHAAESPPRAQERLAVSEAGAGRAGE